MRAVGGSEVSAANGFEQLKGQFLASLNHEIRTPLSGLIGMSDLLAETELSAEQIDYLNGIQECAKQLLDTLNKVLDYSSLSAGLLRLEESEFHVGQVLEGVAAEAAGKAAAKGLKLLFRIEEGIPETAIGDARHLRQAVSHLVGNAVKFTSGGEVEIHVAYEPLSGGRMMLLVTVRDTGPGIDEEKLKLLFESFRQLEGGLARRHAGLGLGLALVERLARLMHGEITVDSRPGEGSSFTLIVPVRLPATAAPLRSRKGLRRSGRRVLMVDDNKIAQRLVEHILGRAGYEVHFADGGEHGIRKASEGRFDLILMDLQMPDMDGLSATRLIRQLPGCEHIPVLAMTANYSDEYRSLCDQVGMQGFLCKPFNKEELLRVVSVHIG
jgi:CheY-like chemotaxis protein/two-component sensor histidine kinase